VNGIHPVRETQRDDILIVSGSTGAGHDTVAMALVEAIHQQAPETCASVFDALSALGGYTPLSPGRWYDTIVDHSPWLWRTLYRVTNREWAVQYGMAAGALLWARRFRATLLARRPRLVVSVHPLATRLAASVLRTMPNPPPLHCVVTDLVTIHRSWTCAAVERYYVATADAFQALNAAGIHGERIQVTGLPLRGSFAPPPTPPRQAALSHVLLLGGGRPSHHLERVAYTLARSNSPLDLVVVCGHNWRLQQRLTRTLGQRATVLGWRNDVAALMRWSDVVITKGGPTTVAEALSQARPVVIFQALEDQETGNVALVERLGSGRYIPNVETLTRAITAPAAAVPSGEAALAAWWGSAAERVAARLLATLRDDTVPLPPDASGLSTYDANDLEAAGHVIHNPVSEERIVIRQSAAQTGGELLVFDLFLPRGAHVPARHVHPHQEERFTVVQGRMRFRLGWWRTILAQPGDTVVVPPGTAHWFGNAGDGVAQARVEARPALRLQEVFERSAAMDVVERFPGTRMPRMSDLALFMLEFQRELAMPGVPAFLVKVFLTPFARWGRRHPGAVS
jgi:1,2-diacylglycerol 3-beta-galactosyltransferase